MKVGESLTIHNKVLQTVQKFMGFNMHECNGRKKIVDKPKKDDESATVD